jgi:predicted phage terminase large subunit-like protein
MQPPLLFVPLRIKTMLLDPKLFAQLGGIDPSRPIDAAATMREFEAEVYEDSLYEFMKAGWRYIDPNPFVESWHLGAIAEHLQAICDGQITRLIINQPPRTSKSSMLVAFDPWVWAQRDHTDTSGPGVQFLHASYAQNLSIRDSVKTRRLIESPWYQKYWGDKVKITSDQNTKIRFDNNAGGYRLATSVGGTLTGEGGGIIIIDDPHNAVEAESEAVRTSTLEWFDNSLSTRLNNPRTGAIILVMQRLHEEDLTGHILSSDAGQDWVHLMLPMRYEKDRAAVLYPNAIGWSDPREEEGELLTPERYDEKSVSRLERQLGPFGAAGQLQQRPEPKGGGILKRDWWQDWESENYPEVSFVVASIDTAYTTKEENDHSAMTVWGVFEDDNEVPRLMLMNAWRAKLELHELVEKIAASCRRFKVDHMLVENKAAGISVAQEIRRVYGYEDWGVQLIDPKGQDKVARAYSVQHLLADGLIYAPMAFSWADMVITECASFPKGKHDDMVDTVTMALRYFRTTGMLMRGSERTADLADSLAFKGNSDDKPLYPV